MTFAELQRLVESVTFCGGLKAWGAELRCQRIDGSKEGPALVTVLLLLNQVPDRDGGLLGEGNALGQTNILSEDTLASMGRETALRWIRRVVILHLVEHELDESILYRGARVLDPHRPEELSSAMRRADEAADEREAEESAFRWAVRSTDPRFGTGTVIALIGEPAR